jgi:hypothetical protein
MMMNINTMPRFRGLSIVGLSSPNGPIGHESFFLRLSATNDANGNHLDQFQTLFGPSTVGGLNSPTKKLQTFSISGLNGPGGKNLLYKGDKVLIQETPDTVRPLVALLLDQVPGLSDDFIEQLGLAVDRFYGNFAFYKSLYSNQ